MAKRGKIVAMSTAAVALVVLVAAGIAGKDRIREEWYVWKLERGDEEEQVLAARKLGEMRSVRAVSELLAAVDWERLRDPMRGFESNFLEEIGIHTKASTAAEEALLAIGMAGAPELMRALASDEPGHSLGAVYVLKRIYAEHFASLHLEMGGMPSVHDEIALLTALRDDTAAGPTVREAAAETLTKIQSR